MHKKSGLPVQPAFAYVKPLFISDSETDSDIGSDRQIRYLLLFDEFVKVIRNVDSANQCSRFAESDLYAAGRTDADHCLFKVDREFCICAESELNDKDIAERDAECGSEIEIEYAPRVELFIFRKNKCGISPQAGKSRRITEKRYVRTEAVIFVVDAVSDSFFFEFFDVRPIRQFRRSSERQCRFDCGQS